MWYYLADKYLENPELYQSLYFSVLPIVVFFIGVCGIMIGVLIRDWNGNAVDTLLLKILDDNESINNKS